MPPRPPDPLIADTAPTDAQLTAYDRAHVRTYLRLLDAAAEGAQWQEVACLVFGIDPTREADRARLMHETHLARARWLTEHGYRHFLRAPPDSGG